jgi:hypothetical protein
LFAIISFYTTGYGFLYAIMAEDNSNKKDNFKVSSSNWTEAKFRIRSICDKHEMRDTISHVAAERLATVVHPADPDDFAEEVGGVMELTNYGTTRYKLADARYKKYEKGVTELRDYIQSITDADTFRIIRDIPYSNHYERMMALERNLQSSSAAAVRNDFKELIDIRQPSPITRLGSLQYTQTVSEIMGRIRDIVSGTAGTL